MANPKSSTTIKPLAIIRRRPVSAALILAIWVVCLVPIPDTPLNDVKFFDKWTHLTMYAALVLVLVLENAIRQKDERRKKVQKELKKGSLNEEKIGLNEVEISSNETNSCLNEHDCLNEPYTNNSCVAGAKVSRWFSSNQDSLRTILTALAAACAMGGLIELAQAYLTAGIRSGDWLDFAANAVGALFGAIIAFPAARVISR